MASLIVQDVIILASLIVQIVTLCYLIKYVRATVGIQRAAVEQTKASQDLAQWQHRQWELDNRKEEWRELISTLTRCFPKIGDMVAVAPNVFAAATPQWVARQQEARSALLEASAAITNRLFITDVLERESVWEDWREVEVALDRPVPAGGPQAPTLATSAAVTGIQQKCVALRRKLLRAAQADLGFAVGGVDRAHR